MFTTNGGANSTATIILVVAAALQMALVITFFAAASDISKIKTLLMDRQKGDRGCQFCRSLIPPEASVCRYCSREVGAWTLQDGTWWTNQGGAWTYLSKGSWNEPDASHPAPSPSP
jgi:hypothetical protein